MEKWKARIQELRKLIAEYDYHYHVLDMPLVSDDEYDILYRELEGLERENPEPVSEESPTRNVVSPGIYDLKGSLLGKIRHSYPILSLEKCYNRSDIARMIDRLVKFTDDGKIPSFTVEPKYDGLSLSILYEEGNLKFAATRGNGEIGEDVTLNALTLKTIPVKISSPESVYIRGEIVVRKKVFEEYNRRFSNIYKNSRNFAAGSLRLKDPEEVRSRPLEFLAYELHGLPLEMQDDKLKFLRDNGFQIPEKFMVYDTFEEMVTDCEKGFFNIKSDSAFDIDGLVIKVREIDLHAAIGNTEKSPRWAFAFKFPAERVSTIIQKVEFQIGKTGFYTPVAKYEAVNIAGTECTSASIHNFDYIRTKDIRIGDRVLIEKAGEIIPQVVCVQKEFRNGSEQEIKPPSACYSCGNGLEGTEDGAFYFCPNPGCPERRIKIIQYFVGKSGIDIKGFGDAIVEKLYHGGRIRDMEDVLRLDESSFADIEGFAEKSISLILDAVRERKKSLEFYMLLRGLSIEGVGTGTARLLAAKFKDIEEMLGFSAAEDSEAGFLKIDDIGPITAKNLCNYLKHPDNIRRLRDIESSVRLVNNLYGPIEENYFSDKKIVITGSFDSFKRSELKDLLSKRGAKVQGSVSRNTDLVIAGTEAGSKLEKAQELNIEIMDEAGLLKVLESSG